ncbi:hypothetical protein [Roseicella aquatilis]|uniref:Uncharacterized protein n=1 Tax=Roseicella aquatilis TaxID=2527868 RepID=A0A4R4D5H1_9PROT|nr:hypothetical protein [Roseicella aquatilis]TCZ55558.1 hypothetical protein EXY23_21130 [Roseicella aquatilis]
MGGLFSAPKPVVVQPTPPPDPAPAQTTPTPEQQGEAARAVARSRAARGLEGTIATSPRGVLDPLPAAPRKTLLGE